MTRLGLAFEDRAYEDVAIPLVRRICAEEGRGLDLSPPLITHGCRYKKLLSILGEFHRRADAVLVGADSRTHRPVRKEQAMRKRIGVRPGGPLLVFVIAEPSIEGWIQADLAALKRGVADHLGEEPTLASDPGPYPTTEEGAKARLKTLLRRADVPILSGGVEYGAAVMRHVRYDAHPSLLRFSETVRRLLRGLPV